MSPSGAHNNWIVTVHSVHTTETDPIARGRQLGHEPLAVVHRRSTRSASSPISRSKPPTSSRSIPAVMSSPSLDGGPPFDAQKASVATARVLYSIGHCTAAVSPMGRADCEWTSTCPPPHPDTATTATTTPTTTPNFTPVVSARPRRVTEGSRLRHASRPRAAAQNGYCYRTMAVTFADAIDDRSARGIAAAVGRMITAATLPSAHDCRPCASCRSRSASHRRRSARRGRRLTSVGAIDARGRQGTFVRQPTGPGFATSLPPGHRRSRPLRARPLDRHSAVRAAARSRPGRRQGQPAVADIELPRQPGAAASSRSGCSTAGRSRPRR